MIDNGNRNGSRWKLWNLRGRDPAVKCGYCGRARALSLWRRLRRRPPGVRLQGGWYCRTECLERILAELFGRGRAASRNQAAATHRVPLGLLLLSRQQVTAEQLRAALEAQRTAGWGKIGGWLQELGFVSEPQVTAALARQWSCPVLRAGPGELGAGRVPPIPALLLESFQMIPVELVEATGTLLVAFSEGIDYTMLYAVEQMLGYRTQVCLVCPSALQQGLQALAQRRQAGDIIFDRMGDTGECARIIGNYAAKMGSEEIRMARCGEHIWVRLEGRRREGVNLVVRAPADTTTALRLYPPAAANSSSASAD
jgi:hypothetical protein